MTYRTITLLTLISLTTTACGDNQAQRALSGGAIGAGVGTVGSVLVGANPVAGAVVGGAVGAVTGAVTNKRQINFGDIR